MTQEIEVNVPPEYLDHFKRELLNVEILKNNVEVKFDGGGYSDRHQLMTSILKRSFEDFPTPRRLNFWIYTGDKRPANSINNSPLYSIAGPRLSHEFIIPDPHSLMWPQINISNFREYCDRIFDESYNNLPKNNSAVWRGTTCQHPSRSFIHKLYKSNLDAVLDIEESSVEPTDSFVSMDQLHNWAILLDFPGQGFSGRLKYLMHVVRPKIVFEREIWDFATLHLEPGHHYISCPIDYNILVHETKKILSNYDHYLQASSEAASIMTKITQRKNISHALVSKILRYV